MKIFQQEITLQAKSRGFHLITDEILQHIDISNIQVGTIHLFLKHTSASLSINENCEREVRTDLENLMNEIADDKPYYTHTYEGEDDMPAHAKASLIGCEVTIPITKGRLNLGTWQGVYLGEHRYHGGSRTIIATIMGE
jgi:secondary thiamine-phosphate synthase enzyme